MSVRVDGYHTIYKDNNYYCGPGPSVVVDNGGLITVAFRRVRSWLAEGHSGHWHPGTELCLTRSADGGQRWSTPQVFLGGYQCPCLTRLRDGTLIHSTHKMELVREEVVDACPQVRGVHTGSWPGIHCGTAIWRSGDQGTTWGKPAWLEGVPDLEPLHPSLAIPVAVRGNVLETGSGRLLISAYDLTDPNSAYLFSSEDHGRNWEYRARIAEGFNETFLYETESGNLVAFMRNWGGDEARLYLARSSDGGETWSTPEALWKGYPACAVRMPSGKVLVAYGYRFEGPGVRARVMSAECAVKESSKEIVIRADGATSDLGYPDSTLLPDGRVMVVYYTNTRSDAPDITAPKFIEGCVLREG
jgi:sialidase-1